jgi:hypothetical protein
MHLFSFFGAVQEKKFILEPEKVVSSNTAPYTSLTQNLEQILTLFIFFGNVTLCVALVNSCPYVQCDA